MRKILKYFLIVCLFALNFDVVANRTLSFAEFLAEMQGAPLNYELDHATISEFSQTDSSGKFNLKANAKILITANVSLNNVRFTAPSGVLLSNFVFENKVVFKNCVSSNFSFQNSSFRGGLVIIDCVFKDFLADSVNFNKGLAIYYNNINGSIRFVNSIFLTLGEDLFREKSEATEFIFPADIRIFKNTPALNELRFTNCIISKVKGSSVPSVLDLSDSEFGSVYFDETHFGMDVNLENAKIEQAFHANNSVFEEHLLVGGLNFSSEYFYFDWKQVEGNKLRAEIYYSNQSLLSSREILTGFTDGRVVPSTGLLFNNIRNKYTKFINAYRQQKNFEGVSNSTNELKSFENDFMRHELGKKDIGFKDKYSNLSQIYLNHLLSISSDHGTNPIKVIVFAIIVVFLFAIPYLFFGESERRSTSSRFFQRLEMLSRYFSTSHSFRQLLYEYKRDKTPYEPKADYSDFVEANKSEIPFYLRIFAKSMFSFLTNFKRGIYYWLLTRTSFLDGKTSTLSFSKKVFKYIFVFILLIIFLIYVVLYRIFYSISQSLNAFITFGFGAIRPTGLGKFLAIVEGFTGWFTMGLFITSLLFQLLS